MAKQETSCSALYFMALWHTYAMMRCWAWGYNIGKLPSGRSYIGLREANAW